MATSPTDNCKEAEKSSGPKLRDHEEKDDVLREEETRPADELDQDKLAAHVQKIQELTSQMASAGRILGAQMVSLHETVCKETEASKEYMRDNDRLPPGLYQKLQDRTSDLHCEVRVLERYLEQLRNLLVLKQVRNNGIKELNDVAPHQENGLHHQSETQQLSIEELTQKLEAVRIEQCKFEEERREWMREIERLKSELQRSGEFESLEHGMPNGNNAEVLKKLKSDKRHLEEENKALKLRLRIIQDKLNESGLVSDEDAISLTDSENEHSGSEGSFSSTELASLQKERKLLLATVLRLQSQGKTGCKTNDVLRVDAAVQCKINVLGQMENQGVSLSSELQTLKKSLAELHAENDELEEENKSLDEENSKLMEEKRSLEDSVNKLKSQITDALDSSLDEMDHLHQVGEELQERLHLAESKNTSLRESIVELSLKNVEHLTSVLDEIERKDSLEDAVDYLASEVERLSEINNLAAESTSEPLVPWDATRKIHNSSLLSEIKTCKELIDSQRNQIRQLQVDKRDVEDSYSNLKREILILRSKRGDDRSVGQPQAGVGTGNMQARKSSHERCQFLKQEILRLTTRRSELEYLIGTLKSDNTNLEEEKVCLLDSLYHQLERNESLEVQIDNLKSVIKGYNDKEGHEHATTNRLSSAKQRDYDEREKDENGNQLERANSVDSSLEDDVDSSEKDLERDHSSLATRAKTATGDSKEELETKTASLSNQLHCTQARVLEIEKEKDVIQRELDESSNREHELRALVTKLKTEGAVLKSQLEKNQEVSDTLQECLREAHEEKEELIESLDEVAEEKSALESKVEMSENQLNELNEQHRLLKNQLESVRVDCLEKAKQPMSDVHAKLSELSESLFDKEGNVDEQSTTPLETVPKEELGTSVLSLTEKINQKVSLLRKELKRVKSDQEKLKGRLETSQTEKLALQKFVRELDDKRRQVKSFIMKLTEEKEFMTEQMDEIRQQKINLADALEHVYQSKENLQCQLEDALCKQHENATCFAEASAEIQSLKSSLCRLADERDAVKQALLEAKDELQALKESEAKLKEKVTGSQVEADQSVETTSDPKKDEEIEAINRLKMENSELKERLQKLMNQSSLYEKIPEETHEGSIDSFGDKLEPHLNMKSFEDEIVVSMASEYGSSPQYQTKTVSFQNAAYEDISELTSELQVSHLVNNSLENAPDSEDKEAFRARYNEVCAEKEVLLEDLKRNAEEIEQLKSWFDSISVEKDNLEKEQERVANENEELLRDLERAKVEEEKLKVRVGDILKQKEASESESEEINNDIQASLEDKEKENKQLRQELNKQTYECKESKESLQLANMRNRSLESEANESWGKATALEKSMKSLREKNDSLNKRISALQKENKEQTVSLEKLTKDYKSLSDKLSIESKQREKIAVGCEQQKKEISQLLENNELLKEQLEKKSQEFKELEEELRDVVKEKEGLDVVVKEMKDREESGEAKYSRLLKEHRTLEDTLLKTRTEKSEVEDSLANVRQELENTDKEFNNEISSLKNSLKTAQDNLDTTEEDLELAEEERDELKGQVEKFAKEEWLLRQQIDLMTQESASIRDSIETLTAKKSSVERKLEVKEIDSDEMKCKLQDFKNQADDLRIFLDQAVRNNSSKQSAVEPSNISQYVRESVESLASERVSLMTSLAEETAKLKRAEAASNQLTEELKVLRKDCTKAESANRQIQDDNSKLLLERTELAIQLQEALGEKDQAKEVHTRHARDEVRLSREISDVRSLIEKLSLQKEKLGAALTHRENQIVTVTAAASEKTKMLQEKEKEAECLHHTKEEVTMALEEAKEKSDKISAELEGEKKRVAGLTQELDNAKRQLRKNQDERTDLKVCVSKLEKEKVSAQKSLTTAESKCKDLEKCVQKLEEENGRMNQRRSEVEARFKAQTESLTTAQDLNEENEEKWKKELDEKDSYLKSVKLDMDKSRSTLLDLQGIVDELRSKERELESRYNQAEKSRKEMLEEKSSLEKKLEGATEAKKSGNTKTKEMEKTLNKYQEENKDLKKCVASIDKEKRSLQSRLKDVEEQTKTMKQRLIDLNTEKKAVEDELERVKFEDASVREELVKKTADLLESEKNVKNLNEFIREGKEKYIKLEEEREELRKSLTATESKLKQAETMAGGTKEQNNKLKEKLEAIEEEMTALNSALDTTRNKEEVLLFEMKTERRRIERELEDLRDECKGLKGKLDKSSKERRELDKVLEQERDQKKGAKEELVKFKEEYRTLKASSQKSAEDLKAECNALKKKLEDSSTERRELDKAREQERDQKKGAKEELVKSKEEYRTLKKSAEDLKVECNALKKKFEDSSTERRDLDKELKQARNQTKGVQEKLLKFKEEYVTLENSSQKLFEDLNVECNTLKKRLEDSSKERRELEKELEQARDERKVAEEELLKFQEEYESLKISSEKFARDTEDAGILLKDNNEENERVIQCTTDDVLSMTPDVESPFTIATEEGNSLKDEIQKERKISLDLRAQLEEIDDEKDELEEIVEELRAKTKKLQREMDVLISEKDSLEDKVDENTKYYKELIGSLNDEKKGLCKQVEVLSKDKTSLCEEIRAKEVEYSDVLEEGKKLEDALEKSNQEVDRLSTELDSALARRKDVEEELKKSRESIKELQNKLEEITLENQDIMSELAERKNENSTLRLAVEEMTLATEDSEMKSGTAEKDQQDKLARLQVELDERNTTIASLEEEITEYKRMRYEDKEMAIALEDSELKSGTAEKDQQDKLARLQVELDERDNTIQSLQEQITEYKRMRYEEERNFNEKEANLAAAREEFYRTSEERWEEEERLESVRKANNRLQEALDIAKDETNQLRKQLQEVNDRVRAKGVPDTSVAYERVKKTSVAGQLECGVEKVLITSSEVPELSQVSPAMEMNQAEEPLAKPTALDNARKEIALLESHVQELRSELRKARDQVFDLQHELSDSSRALKQQERLHQAERKRFEANIDEMEKEYNKLRSEFSTLIAMEKKRSSFTTVKDLKGTLRKAESDMLEAIAKTAELLSRAKNDIKEGRTEPEIEDAEKFSRRARSFTDTPIEGRNDLLKQLDEVSKERERLERRLKRAEGTKVLFKQILNETSIELERFKRLVNFGDQQKQEHETNTSSQTSEISTQELQTQSHLTATDLEETEGLKTRLEELRKNIRGLEGCLGEERSRGQGNLLDYLRVKNKLQAEKSALQQCLKESERKNEALQMMVNDLKPKLELAQKENTAVEKEIAEVRSEVRKLRNLSYDEREGKNSLKQENAELKRVLLEEKENYKSVTKDAEKLKELSEEKERLIRENEELKSSVLQLNSKLDDEAKKDEHNHAQMSEELERAQGQINELSTTKEALETKNNALETKLLAEKENLKVLDNNCNDLENRYKAMEERWKDVVEKYDTLERELQVKNETVDVLERDYSDLEYKFRALEERWEGVDEERILLIEDTHSFKLKLEKKNHDLVSKVEAKEHEVISLEAKIEGLGSIQKKLEGDVRCLEKDKDEAMSQVRALESAKERVEATNKELKIQIERLVLSKGDQDDLNERLKNLFSENDKLDAMNRSLETSVQKLKTDVAEKSKENETLLHETQEMTSKVKQLETEKEKEVYLKEQLAAQLNEKDREMKTKTKVLSSRLDGILMETENLKTSSGKMEQMGIEFSRLEDENVLLIETAEKAREENFTLKKENDLLRRACEQLRARKSIPEERIVADIQSSEVGSEPVFRKDSSHRLFSQEAAADTTSARRGSDEYLVDKWGQGLSRKFPELAHDIKLSRAPLDPAPSLTVEGPGRRFINQRAQNTPPIKHRQRASLTEPEIRPHGAAPMFKGASPSPSDTGSSRSSETDHSVCSRNFYCSPILSLVDMCPLHRNPSIERPPSQCPICKKDKRRTGTVPKEFVTLEKYV